MDNEEQKAMLPFWSHSDLDNKGQIVHPFSKYASNDQNHRPPGIAYIHKYQSNSNIRQFLFHVRRWRKSQLINDTKENMGMRILANENRSKISHLYSNLSLSYCKHYSWWLQNVPLR